MRQFDVVSGKRQRKRERVRERVKRFGYPEDSQGGCWQLILMMLWYGIEACCPSPRSRLFTLTLAEIELAHIYHTPRVQLDKSFMHILNSI